MHANANANANARRLMTAYDKILVASTMRIQGPVPSLQTELFKANAEAKHQGKTLRTYLHTMSFQMLNMRFSKVCCDWSTCAGVCCDIAACGNTIGPQHRS